MAQSNKKINLDNLVFSEFPDKSWGSKAIRYDIHKDNKNIASAIVRPNPRKELGGMTLSDLQVHKDYRGCGLGRILLKHILNKYDNLYLRPQPYKSDGLSEDKLREFYASEGFRPFGNELMKYKKSSYISILKRAEFLSLSKKENIPLSTIKKIPYKTLNRMLNKMRAFLKKDSVVQKMFKEYNLDINEVDYIPMKFDNIDVSAKTEHGIIIFNYKLLSDKDFLKDYSYGVHEMTHFCQQTGRTEPTQSSDDGDYLSNKFEQEGFAAQVEYIANHEGEDTAKEYVDDLLDHHEIKSKPKKDELKAIFLENV